MASPLDRSKHFSQASLFLQQVSGHEMTRKTGPLSAVCVDRQSNTPIHFDLVKGQVLTLPTRIPNPNSGRKYDPLEGIDVEAYLERKNARPDVKKAEIIRERFLQSHQSDQPEDLQLTTVSSLFAFIESEESKQF